MKNKIRIPKISDEILEQYQNYYEKVIEKYNPDTVSRLPSETREALATEIMRLKTYRKEKGLHPLSTKQAIKIVAQDQITGTSSIQRKFIRESIREGAEYMDFDINETTTDRINAIIYRQTGSSFYKSWSKQIDEEYKALKNPNKSKGYYKKQRYYEDFIFRASQGNS